MTDERAEVYAEQIEDTHIDEVYERLQEQDEYFRTFETLPDFTNFL